MIMQKRLNKQGFSLIELLVVVAMLGIILAVIFSEYIRVLQQAAVTRKVVKTETDIVNVVWPLFKEIESAGFGIPAKSMTGSGSSCTKANDFSAFKYDSANNRIIIHSTAVGDKKNAGAWSAIGSSCKVSGIPAGEYVAVINPSGMAELGWTSTLTSGTDVILASCDPMWIDMIAYWTPDTGGLECGEAFYRMTQYTSSNKPAICAPSGSAADEKVGRLMRSIAYNAGQDNSQPMLECIRDFSFRFGCISKTSGSLTWVTDAANCSGSTGDLRLVKIGMIVQESPADSSYMAPTTITLFSDLGASLQKTVNIIPTQRNYRWRPIERTIVLRNLE